MGARRSHTQANADACTNRQHTSSNSGAISWQGPHLRTNGVAQRGLSYWSGWVNAPHSKHVDEDGRRAILNGLLKLGGIHLLPSINIEPDR